MKLVYCIQIYFPGQVLFTGIIGNEMIWPSPNLDLIFGLVCSYLSLMLQEIILRVGIYSVYTFVIVQRTAALL